MATLNGAGSSSRQLPVMDIKVKEIIDLTYFWAQIGAANQLDEFEDQIVTMSAWCEACTAGCYQSSAFLKVEKIVAVKEADEDRGRWTRAKVTRIISDRQVELFHVDSGVISIVHVHQICANTPPMMMAIPQQALHCVLNGVKKINAGDDEWSEEANALFAELVSIPTKVMIHEVMEEKRVLLSIFAPYQGHYTSVGEVMRKKGLAQYEPLCSPILDIPVPPEFAGEDDRIVQEKLPAAPLLNTYCYGYYNGSDDPDSNISIDNSVISRKEDELETSICLPDREDTRCNEEEKAEGIVKDEGNIENHSASTTSPGSLASPDEESGKECGSNVSPLPSDNDVVLGSSLSAVVIAPVEAAPVIFTEPGVASEEDKNANKSSGWKKNFSPDGYKVARKTDHMYQPLKEEIAKLTSHVRTKQQKIFLEDTLGGDGSNSSSLSDGDWLNESILPRVEEKPKMQMPGFVLKAEQRALQLDFLRMNSNAGNTPYPCSEKRRARSHLFSNSAPSQRSFGRQKSLGKELYQDRCPRGRGEFQPRSISSTKLSKKFGNNFDLDKSEQKKARGRGTQSHMSSRPSALSLSPIPHTVTAVATETSTNSKGYTHQLEKMNEQEIADEVKWQVWKFEKEIDRVVSSLDAVSISNFEKEVKKLLSGSTAEKLNELPNSISPLEVLVSFFVRQGISESLKLNLVVRGLELLMNGQCGDGTCEVLVKVMTTIAEELLQCGSDDGREKCTLLCAFVGLLVTSSTARKAKHRDSIDSGVKQCFVTWSKCLDSSVTEQSKKIQVFCCNCLLGGISSRLSTFKEVLVELVEGPIRQSILNVQYSEDLREAWLSYTFRILKCVYQDKAKASVNDEERPSSPGTVTNTGSKIHSEGTSSVAVAQNAGSDPKQHTTEMQQFEMEPNQQQKLFRPCLDQVHSEDPPTQLQVNPYVVYSPVTGGNFGYLKPLAPTTQMSTSRPEAYARVTQMLNALNLTEVMPKFKAAMIKDTVLEYGVEAVKGCLKDAGIPSGAILEITSYLQHQISSGYPPAQQPHQAISSTIAPKYPSAESYLPSLTAHTHSVSQFNAAQQQNMRIDGQHMYNIPRMESQILSPSSPFPMVDLTTNPSGSQVDHHHQLLQHQSQLHQQNVCRSVNDLTTDVLGDGRPMSPAPPFPLVALPLSINSPGSQLDHHHQLQNQPLHQQDVLITARNLGLSSTGQYGVVHTASNMSLGINPAIATTAMPISNDASSLVEPVAFSALPSDSVTPTATNIRPGGFGRITCVICGGNDHATRSCSQREKLFLHM